MSSEHWSIARDTLVNAATKYGLDLIGAVFIVIIGWLASRWAGRAAHRLAEGRGRDTATLAPIASKLARAVVLIATLIAVLDRAGVETTSLLAALGTMGLALGLALKDTVSDFAAGIVLVVLRPFSHGDRVALGDIEGVVEAVDAFDTTLIALDGVPTVIANRNVRSAVIRNITRATRRRFDIVVGVAYDVDIDEAIRVVSEAVALAPNVLDTPAPIVNAADLADSSVNILIRLWIVGDDAFAVSLDVRRRVKLALDAANIEIPFPQRVLHVASPVAISA